MNRKLHNSMLALSTSGLVLLAGLMVVVSGTSESRPPVTVVQHETATREIPVVAASTKAMQARARAIQARARAFEARIEPSASAADVLAETAAFTAQVATETALIATFQQSANDHKADQAAADRQQRRHVHRSRAALALPYFSFAQGMRRNRS